MFDILYRILVFHYKIRRVMQFGNRIGKYWLVDGKHVKSFG